MDISGYPHLYQVEGYLFHVSNGPILSGLLSSLENVYVSSKNMGNAEARLLHLNHGSVNYSLCDFASYLTSMYLIFLFFNTEVKIALTAQSREQN